MTTALSLDPSTAQKYPFLAELGIADVNEGCFDGTAWAATGDLYAPVTPITGQPIGPMVRLASVIDTQRSIANMMAVKAAWAQTPAPKRGDIVRQIGNRIREKLVPLGKLLSLEVGKILPEGKGEVQEYIDICDFATGLSRQMPGQVIPSERPEHFMMEQWHPLGAIGVICAFNFPVAVAGWNTAISLVAGNTQIWKCAPTTILCSIATQKIIQSVLVENGLPGAIATFVAGGKDVGEAIVDAPQIPLVSFTGSTEVGRIVNQRLAARFGKPILELGGNNAIVIMDDANVEMAVRATLFGAVGTCGQRCTAARRLYIHESLYDAVVSRLATLYGSLTIGNPLEDGVLVGPLHTLEAVKKFKATVAQAQQEGGTVRVGGKVVADAPGPNYVQPTIIEIGSGAPVVQHEAFVPILYVMKFQTLEEAIQLNNAVDQGLSASLFTTSIRNQYLWTGPCGADTGLCNVNIPTNGAEIGGAFGGEKATGGGRESGSDAWKQYMRRQTNTVNYGTSLPLAQGINFGSD